jgi:hypothetical protein
MASFLNESAILALELPPPLPEDTMPAVPGGNATPQRLPVGVAGVVEPRMSEFAGHIHLSI